MKSVFAGNEISHIITHMHSSHSAFTLVEMVMVITIIAIISVGLYVPYNYYTNVALVKDSAVKVQQVLAQAKLNTKNGILYPNSNHNADIAVEFLVGSGTIKTVAFAAGTETGNIVFGNGKTLSETNLDDGITIQSILPNANTIVLYRAPNAKIAFLQSDSSGTIQPVTASGITVQIAFKNATGGGLVKSVTVQ